MPADLQYVSPPAERQLLDKPELQQEAAQLKSSDAQPPAAASNSQAQSAETANSLLAFAQVCPKSGVHAHLSYIATCFRKSLANTIQRQASMHVASQRDIYLTLSLSSLQLLNQPLGVA